MIVTCFLPHLLAVRLTATTHNVLIGLLVTAGLLTKGGFTPWALGTRKTDGLDTFTTTMWMVARAHCSTTNCRANTEVTLASCFAKLDVAMVEVTHLTNRGITNLMNQANLTRRHADLGKIAFFSKQLRRTTSGTNKLTTTPASVFDIVDHGPNRDVR
jgi:hypothetical protein